jgi:hypothetical protein
VRQGDLNVALPGNQLVISGERKAPEGFSVLPGSVELYARAGRELEPPTIFAA